MNLAVGVLLYIPVRTTDLVVLGLVLVAVCIGGDLTEYGTGWCRGRDDGGIMIALNLRNFIFYLHGVHVFLRVRPTFASYLYVSDFTRVWQETYSVLFLTKKSQDLDNQSSGIFRSATRIRTWE